MKLEYQCTSLELSKRLKELGVKQESLFYWYYCYPNGNPPSKWTIQYSTNGLMSDRYSAFTVAEHLAILPHRITLPENEPYNSFRIRIEKGIWVTEQSLKLNDIKYCDFIQLIITAIQCQNKQNGFLIQCYPNHLLMKILQMHWPKCVFILLKIN